MGKKSGCGRHTLLLEDLWRSQWYLLPRNAAFPPVEGDPKAPFSVQGGPRADKERKSDDIEICQEFKQVFSFGRNTFFGLSPCLRTCSRTMKKCWRGMWSESNWRPNFRLESITSLMTSFKMFTRLLLSIRTGSRSEKNKQNFYSCYNNRIDFPNVKCIFFVTNLLQSAQTFFAERIIRISDNLFKFRRAREVLPFGLYNGPEIF